MIQAGSLSSILSLSLSYFSHNLISFNDRYYIPLRKLFAVNTPSQRNISISKRDELDESTLPQAVSTASVHMKNGSKKFAATR